MDGDSGDARENELTGQDTIIIIRLKNGDSWAQVEGLGHSPLPLPSPASVLEPQQCL